MDQNQNVIFKAEIKAGGETYLLAFPEAKDPYEAYERALVVATGADVYHSENYVLDINVERYDHIKVWAEPVAPAYVPPAAEDIENTSVVFGCQLKYLGRNLHVIFANYREGNAEYLLPFRINGEVTSNVLKLEKLEELTRIYAEQYNDTGLTIHHVQPHGDIPTNQEALDFITDYVNEVRKTLEEAQHKAKNATAFEWKEDDEQ